MSFINCQHLLCFITRFEEIQQLEILIDAFIVDVFRWSLFSLVSLESWPLLELIPLSQYFPYLRATYCVNTSFYAQREDFHFSRAVFCENQGIEHIPVYFFLELIAHIT